MTARESSRVETSIDQAIAELGDMLAVDAELVDTICGALDGDDRAALLDVRAALAAAAQVVAQVRDRRRPPAPEKAP